MTWYRVLSPLAIQLCLPSYCIHVLWLRILSQHSCYTLANFQTIEANFHPVLESSHIPLDHLPWAAPTLGVPFGSFAFGTKPSFIFCVTWLECDYASSVVSPFACIRPPPVVAYIMKRRVIIHHFFGHPTLRIYSWTSYTCCCLHYETQKKTW